MWIESFIVEFLNRLSAPRSPNRGTGLVLGRRAERGGHTVVWPHARRAEHLCVIGKTGAGKTHFMEQLAEQLMQAREPFVFFDYHGDATNHLVRLASRHRDAADRLVVVDPTDPARSPGLNPLEPAGPDERSIFGSASELASILRQRWSVEAFGARTEELLRNTLYVLSATRRTLVEAPAFLTSTDLRAELVAQIRNPDIVEYWTERYEPLSEAQKGAFREPLLNKVTAFLTEPACRHLLGQQTSTLRFREAMEEGRWILINLAKGRLREHAHTLGNLVFARLQFEILARANVAEGRRRLVTVFADEVQHLAENDLATLLAEGRKFRVSLITGHQFWDQLPHHARGAILSAGSHVFFRLSSADATALSSELSVAAKHRYLRELTQLNRGQAIARIGGSSPMTFVVPPLPKVTATAHDIEALRRESINRVARPRTDIEAEIIARRKPAPEGALAQNHAHDPHEGQHGW